MMNIRGGTFAMPREETVSDDPAHFIDDNDDAGVLLGL